MFLRFFTTGLGNKRRTAIKVALMPDNSPIPGSAIEVAFQ